MRPLIILVLLLTSCFQKVEKDAFYPQAFTFEPHVVGYKTLETFDITRPAIPYSDWQGNLYKTPDYKGRQFQINIWYPAENATSTQLTIGNYIDLTARSVYFEQTKENLNFGRQEIVSKVHDLGNTDSLKSLDVFNNLTTKAYLNARPIDDKFPLIVYPNGIAPFTTAPTCEMLASYGFVVVSFQMKGVDSSTSEASTIGADIGADDLKFILSEVLKLDFVDNDKIALIGNAIVSSFCVAHLVKNENIDAFISLEGGFISNYEQTILNDIPAYQPHRLNIPMLCIYS
ncbi:MAG: hypothetical protein RLO81_19990, partial [Fulvivirga sp.]|uniref:hypothetical protein n=1 Tax=Fulvivirga sp. TaxID=1931237 RepID=UPI0032EDF86B